MVKHVNVAFNDDEFEELKRRKDRLGLSWTEVIRRGLECLEREAAKGGQSGVGEQGVGTGH